MCVKFFVERQRWHHAARENRKARKMAFFRRTQYYDLFRKKAVTVHVENVTIKWLIDDYVIKIYFPESTTHPESGKIGDEFHFWNSKTKVIIIPEIAPEKYGTPKLEKANNGQTVFTLHAGTSTLEGVSYFALKVNRFAARFNTFTMSADGLN